MRDNDLILAREPFTEEKSAKEPGRLVFNEVLSRIEKGEADGLLCWDIDRLYRNPVDEGRLRWLLQRGIIRVIRTPYRQFYPDDAGLLMGVEGGRATDYVIRLSKNVKRGLNSKAMRGWRPCGGPIGYINVGTERGSKTIEADPERFELIRKMFDLFLTGSYSVSTILKIATEEWGLRTVTHRKRGGMPLSMSHLYKILNDPFYYGFFPWKDPDTGEKRLLRGNHPPMVTETEYWRAQALLGRKGRPRPKARAFAYTGIMRCGECSSSITAEEKHQLICSECKYKFSYENRGSCPKCDVSIESMHNPTILHYIYYRCTKKVNRTCSQKTVRLENLESQFTDELSKITIDPEYLRLALDYLGDKQNDFGKEETSVRRSVESAYDAVQTRIKILHREYTSPQNSNYSLYTPQEFAKMKQEAVAEREQLERQLEESKTNLDRSLEATERTFNFCTFATHHFQSGDLQQKRAIFSAIGSNMTLKDRKLHIQKLHPFLLIENELKTQESLKSRLEHKNTRKAQKENTPSGVSIPNLQGRQDLNLQPTVLETGALPN